MSKKRDELIADINNVELIDKDPNIGLSFEEVELRTKQGFSNKTPKKVTKSILVVVIVRCLPDKS